MLTPKNDMEQPKNSETHRFEVDYYQYLAPESFRVLGPSDESQHEEDEEDGRPITPEPDPAPEPYKLTPRTRRRRNQAFAILAESTSSLNSSRSGSPTGRVSPFRGRGFNPTGSRHASPIPSSPPPTNNRIKSSISQIPIRRRSSEEDELYYELSSNDRKRYNQRQRQPALTSGYSKSMTNISPRNLLAKPPMTPSNRSVINSRYNYLRLSPIVGSSPEPSSDQNQSSPSRIPRSKSQPPSRYVTPNTSRAPSRATSRNVSRNPSRNASRETSPTSRSPSKIPRTNNNTLYRTVTSKIDSNVRKPIITTKPKVLPKPNPVVSRSVTINRNRPGTTRKELHKLEEQSSTESKLDDDEDWNDRRKISRGKKSTSSIQSRLDKRLESRPSVSSWTSHKFNMYVNNKNDINSINNNNIINNNNSNNNVLTTESIPGIGAKESRKESMRQSLRNLGQGRRLIQHFKKGTSASEESSKDDDILSITIDSTGMSPTTELVSQAAATMAQPAHVEAKLIKSRESLNSMKSQHSGTDTPSSTRSSKRVSEASTTTVFERQISDQPTQPGSGKNSVQGSTTHSVRQSVTGSTTHTGRSSQGGKNSNSGSTTHSYKATPPPAPPSATPSGRGSTTQGPPPSASQSRAASRQNSQSSEPGNKLSIRTSVTGTSQKDTPPSRQPTLLESPGKHSITSNESTVSVISRSKMQSLGRSIATVSSLTRNKKSSTVAPTPPQIRTPTFKGIGRTIVTIDRLRVDAGTSKVEPTSPTQRKSSAKPTTPKASMKAAASVVSTTKKSLIGSKGSLTSTPSEKSKKSRTVVVDEIKPIKITVKEKGVDPEVQSGNVSMPRSATNGTSPAVPPADGENPCGEGEEGKRDSVCSRIFNPCCKSRMCQCCKRKPKEGGEIQAVEEPKEKGKKGKDKKDKEDGTNKEKTSCWNCCKRKPKGEGNEPIVETDPEDKPPGCWKRMKCSSCCQGMNCFKNCCKKKNKVADSSEPSPGCFAKFKRKKQDDNWAKKREREKEKAATDAEKPGCCSCWRRLFCCCCKGKRKTSMLSQKKSMTSSIQAPVEDNRPKLDLSLVEHTSHMRGAVPVLPIPVAWICLFLNVFIPGAGTIISGMICLCIGKPRFSQHDGAKPRIGAFIINIIVGFSQVFCVLFCLVGWGWSIWWGVIMVKCARKYKKLKAAEALAEKNAAEAAENADKDVEKGA